MVNWVIVQLIAPILLQNLKVYLNYVAELLTQKALLYLVKN